MIAAIGMADGESEMSVIFLILPEQGIAGVFLDI